MIKLGPVMKKDLPAGPLADGIFGLPKAWPEPISRRSAGMSVRINSIELGKLEPFEEVKDKLEKEIKAQHAPDLLIKQVTDYERALSKTQSMNTAAQESASRS